MNQEEKQAEEKPKDEKEKIVVVTAIVTILSVAFIGGLVYAGKKYSDRKRELKSLKEQMENMQKSSETAGEATVTGEAGTAAEDGTATGEYAGWNTFINGEIGYSLKYPADWTVKETGQYDELRGAEVKYVVIESPRRKYWLHWGLKEKDADFAITDRTGMGAGDIVDAGKITILGTETNIRKLVWQGKTKEYFYSTSQIGRSLTKDGLWEFLASFSYGDGTDWNSADITDAAEKILADKIFKSVSLVQKTSAAGCSQNFTNEENLNKADWKTFSNGKYGYTFEYPKSLSVGEKQDDYTGLGSGADQQSFEWRSGVMTATDYYGFKEDRSKNMKVGCQNAKITYFSGDPTADPPGDAQDRLIMARFEKNGIPHMILFSYHYIGASLSSDVVEMFELILKTVKFNK